MSILTLYIPRICDGCLAGLGVKVPEEMCYKNLGNSAAWQYTEIDHESYVKMGGKLSHWMVLPGWRVETVALDAMHNIFLGTAKDLVGSSIRTLLLYGAFGHVAEGEVDAKLRAVQKEMVASCKDAGFLGYL